MQDLQPDEAQREIADAARDFLTRRATRDVVRAVVDAGTGFDPVLWQELGALGWCALTVPEAQGGLGLGLCELVVLEEAQGAHLTPVPFLEAASLCASVLTAPGLQGQRWVQHLLGDAPPVMTLALELGHAQRPGDVPQGQHLPQARQLGAGGGAWVLDGLWPQVPAAAHAKVLLLPAQTAQGLALFAVEPDAHGASGAEYLKITPRRGIDLTQSLADVQADGLQLPADACIGVGPAVEAALHRARLVGALALAAEQVGLADAALAASVAYTGQRVQFGRPVAAFQAVKHRCAQMMVALESARSAVRGAAAVFDQPGATLAALTHAAAQARVLATEAALFCTRENLQLHGGAGYTWEVDAHLMLRRAQVAAQRFGAEGVWLENVAHSLWSVEAAGKSSRPGSEQCFLPSSDEALRQAQRNGAAQGDGRFGDPAASAPAAAAPSTSAAAASAKDVDAIRHDIRAWLEAQWQGDFAALKGLHGPGEPGFDAGLARRWEQALASGGWTAVGWPREHGGLGWSLAQQVAFHEEYARSGGPGRLGHIGETLLAPTLLMHGTPEQQARFLPPIREGREFWAQGYSEPGAGSDLAAVRTRARLEDGQWVIDGQKVWTSWAHLSDWIFVLARTEPGSQRHQGLTLLLVPLRQPGVEVRPIRQITGHSEFNEVFFDGARTEASLHLGPVGQGWRVAMDLLQVERGVSTLGQQAHFRQELEAVVAMALRNGAAADPVLRRRIARAALCLDNLRCNALRVLGGGEAPGGAAGPDRAAFIAKYAWSNWRRELGQLAMEVLGPEGLVEGADPEAARLQRLWLESRADTIYAGTNEIQLNLIAERALGMPR
jgi:alkylation response protein AidB-like acyl-CoA dehydrogenase